MIPLPEKEIILIDEIFEEVYEDIDTEIEVSET